MEEVDYAIIGHGAAAFAAAIKADSLGLDTIMIGKNVTEGALIGGTCVNVGCVPSKRLITLGEFVDDIRKARYAGINASIDSIDFKKIIAQKDAIVEGFRDKKYSSVLKSLKHVSYINEFGAFKDKNTIIVGKKEINAKNILVATGARPYVPKVEGIESVNYLTNEEALSIKELPESMIVVGGRALGLEFAQMFAHFGVKVTILQRSKTIIPDWEPEVVNFLSGYLEEEGIAINTGVDLKEIGINGTQKYIKGRMEGVDKTFAADEILFATGRIPNIEKLNLNEAGVSLSEHGFIKVDEMLKTSASGIYAAGDVTGEPMLETVAAKEGNAATQNAFTKDIKKINIAEIPSAIFTMPEAAKVGFTDAEAHSNGIKCSCGAIPLSLVPKAGIIGDERGLIKIVIDYKTKRIVGTSILARNAADLIMEATLAVKFKLTIDDIIDTVHVFPTLSEAMKLASQNFYQDVSKLSCCTV